MRRASDGGQARPRHPWHLYPLGAAGLVIVGLAIAQLGPESSSARTSRQTVTAANGVVQSTVSGSGNVEAGTDLNVNFQTGGTLQHVYVTQGQRVYAGQLLATLDPTAAALTLDQAQESLTAAEDQLSAAKTNAVSATSSSNSSGTASNASDTTSGSSARFVSDTQLVATTTSSAAAPTPSPKPLTTTTRTATTTTSPAARTVAPRSARTTTGARTTSGTTAAGGSGSASSSGATTNSAATAESNAASIASAQANVDSAEANLRTAEIAVNNTRLYAPVDGTLVALSSSVTGDTISSGSTSAGANSGSSGSAASSSSPSSGSLGGAGSSSAGSGSGSSSSSSSSSSFAEIVNTRSMSMTVALSESDISRVHDGQAANVTLDALSGVELAAHVTHIATVGTTSSSVVSYNVTLTLDQRDGRVKPGMSASASVIVGSAQGVTVPNAAVTGTGTLARVTLLRNGSAVSQPVVVGVRGDSRTQIISGVSAGQQLVVTTTLPALGSSSAASGSSGTLGGGTGRRALLGGGGFGGAGFGGVGFGGAGPPAGP